ncbi:MAG: tRNA (guanosine(37)-N1)-methyltransferase TrmD, partial [Spirochaetia bacterium]
MKVLFLSLFPSIPKAYFETSIMARAVERGIITCESIDIRDFTSDRHRTCDDAPYGGGAGMVFKPEPLAAALDYVGAQNIRTVYPSPSGRLFNQEYAEDLAGEEELVFICGRYEGIDQRIIDTYVDDEISLGDYVMSSGELA